VLLAPGEENPMTDEPMTDEPIQPSGTTPPRRGRRSAQAAPASAAAGPDAKASEALDDVALPETSAGAVLAPGMPTAVEFARGAVGGIRAQDVHVRSGVVGGIAGEHASVEMGLVGGMAAREASVSQAVVRTVLAQDVRIEQSLVRTVIANRVQVGPTTAIAFVLARRVDGNPRILLDWRGVLALAAVFGALAAVFRVSRRKA
jgi:hypothetical protein